MAIEVDVYGSDDEVVTSDFLDVWEDHRAEIRFEGEIIAFIHADGTFTCPAAEGVADH